MCLRVYVCVCVRPQLSRALSYIIPLLCHYSLKMFVYKEGLQRAVIHGGEIPTFSFCKEYVPMARGYVSGVGVTTV